MSKPQFVYVTYIASTPEKVWTALTAPEFTRQCWFGTHHDTDWKPGSPWRLMFDDGRVADAGEIVEAQPPRRLVARAGAHVARGLQALLPQPEFVVETVRIEVAVGRLQAHGEPPALARPQVGRLRAALGVGVPTEQQQRRKGHFAPGRRGGFDFKAQAYMVVVRGRRLRNTYA